MDLSGTTALLVDADGTMFGSEEPAYAAAADVTNRLLAGLGAERAYDPEELRAMTNGMNFRAASQELAAGYGKDLDPADLEHWVAEEKEVVTAHLRGVLVPDPAVDGPLRELASRYVLAAVTSSALSRLDACLQATGLADLFPARRRFSAEDSLLVPVSKPDPAVYEVAARRLGVTPADAVAVEDSVNGVRSAVAAGFRTVGTVQFVPAEEREARVEALRAAGASTVVDGLGELVTLLRG